MKTLHKIMVLSFVLMSMLTWTNSAKAQTLYISTDTVGIGDSIIVCMSSYSEVTFVTSMPDITWEYNPSMSVTSNTVTLTQTNNGDVSMIIGGVSFHKHFWFFMIPAPVSPGLADKTFCGGTFTHQLNALNDGILAHYHWSTGANTQTINVSQPGSYSVTISNECGVISDTMTVTIDTSNDASLGPDQVVCLGNSVVLTTGNVGITNYTWSTGIGNVPSITANTSGTYSVTTTDVNGCASTDEMILTVLTPPTPEITVVSANTDYYSPSFGDNIVEWDSVLYTNGTMHIYRQVGGVYLPVGLSLATSGKFQDTVSSAAQAQWYKISYQDSCGNEGAQSGFFKSLKSWAYRNINDQVVVTWEPVLIEAKSIQQYRVCKFVSGTLVEIGVANPGDLSFTDLNPTPMDTNYMACAVIDTSAKSFLMLAFSNPTVATDTSSGITENNMLNLNFEIYPNPSSDVINIQSEEELFVVLIDLVGRVILTSHEKSISVKYVPTGVYVVKVTNNAGESGYKKIIINH